MRLAELKDGRVLAARPSSVDVEEPDILIYVRPSIAEPPQDTMELTWHEARDLRNMLNYCLSGEEP